MVGRRHGKGSEINIGFSHTFCMRIIRAIKSEIRPF